MGVLRAVLDRAYDRVARTGRPLDPPLLVVLDEAANIAPVPDLDALAATAAGHGIQLVTVWHDLAQITARFGPRATTVVNNHRAKLFLSGHLGPVHPRLRQPPGRRRGAPPAGHHVGRAVGPSTTRSPTMRRLAPPDALRRMPPGAGRPRLPRPAAGPAHPADLVRRPVARAARAAEGHGAGSAPTGRVIRRSPDRYGCRDPASRQCSQSEVMPTTADPSWSLSL